jgi:hypothetical protein
VCARHIAVGSVWAPLSTIDTPTLFDAPQRTVTQLPTLRGTLVVPPVISLGTGGSVGFRVGRADGTELVSIVAAVVASSRHMGVLDVFAKPTEVRGPCCVWSTDPCGGCDVVCLSLVVLTCAERFRRLDEHCVVLPFRAAVAVTSAAPHHIGARHRPCDIVDGGGPAGGGRRRARAHCPHRRVERA